MSDAAKHSQAIPAVAAPSLAAPAFAEIGLNCLCLQSRMTARAVTRAYDAALKPVGLKATGFSLLVAVAHGGARSMTELADHLAMERTTLVRNVDLMVRDGLVARAAAGRAATLVLTTAGHRQLERALPLWQAAQATILRRLGDDDGVRSALKTLRRACGAAKRVRAGAATHVTPLAGTGFVTGR